MTTSTDVIQLIFQSIDKTSQTVNGIIGKLGQLESSVNRINGNSGIGSGIGLAIGFKGVDLAINAASASMDFFINKLDEAMKIDVMTDSITGQIASFANMSFENSSKLIDGLNDKIIEQTAILPGLTKSYTDLGRNILDSVIPAVTDLNGKFNTEELLQFTTELSKAFGFAGQTAGLETGAINRTLTRALSGTASIAELSRLDLFERNPILMNLVKEELVKRGVSELKELDAKARIEVLRSVGNRFLTDDTVARISQSLMGRIEGVMTTLFDPNVGVFGFLRKLSNKGNQTVLDAVNAAFGQLLDLFEAIGKIIDRNFEITSTSGLEAIFDFFTYLAQQINALEFWIETNTKMIDDAINQVKNAFKSDEGVMKFFFELGTKLTNLLFDLLQNVDYNAVIDFLDRFNKGLAAFILGVGVALVDRLPGEILRIASAIFNELIDIAKNVLTVIIDWIKKGASSFTDQMKATPPTNDELERQMRALGTNPGNIPNRANGQIPAIQAEMLAAPGTKPVIANSSEYIFNQGQMREFLDNINSPNININLGGVIGNKEEIGKYLVSLLTNEWKNYKSGYIPSISNS